MTEQENILIRSIVDSIGWDGLRTQYPDLWKKIQVGRLADEKWLDAVFADS